MNSDANQFLAKMDGYLSRVLKADLFKNSIFEPGNLNKINRYMLIVAILLLLYLVIDIIMVSPYKNANSKISDLSVAGLAGSSAQAVMPVEMKSYAYYSNRMPSRSIFGAGSYSDTDSVSGSAVVTDDSVGLVGILTGNDPQAIVEDKKSQQTYYLKKGQSVNGITLEDIGDGRVTLDCRGKKITLLL